MDVKVTIDYNDFEYIKKKAEKYDSLLNRLKRTVSFVDWEDMEKRAVKIKKNELEKLLHEIHDAYDDNQFYIQDYRFSYE